MAPSGRLRQQIRREVIPMESMASEALNSCRSCAAMISNAISRIAISTSAVFSASEMV